jgi:hypothetical protein
MNPRIGSRVNLFFKSAQNNYSGHDRVPAIADKQQ